MIRRAMQRDLSPSEISLRPRRKTGTPGEYSRDLNWNGRSLTVRRRALPSFQAERISSAGRIYALTNERKIYHASLADYEVHACG
jgi:hypothetical protein